MNAVVQHREGYRRWAETFDTSASPIVALESRYLTPLLKDLAGKTFLDIGCGTGRWITWAIERGACVSGVDSSPEMLRVAARKPGIAGRIVQADGTRTPFRDGLADIVLCALTLGHMQPVQAAISELARLAKPGGRVLVTDFHPEALRRGWKRTFRVGSSVFEIESDPYSRADLAHDNLILEDFRELHFDEPERPLFEAAGRGAAFKDASEIPAILMACFRRRTM